MGARAINILSLCTGGGGLDLGIELAVGNARLVCCVEHEAYACAVLAARMEDQALDDAPIWTDLQTFDGKPWRGIVHLISSGFPCQPWSMAGERKGTDDERWLWPDVARVIREVEPRWVFLENVPGLLSGGAEHVLRDLAALGFDAEWGVFSAAEVGASHLRERVFILADAEHRGGETWREPSGIRAPFAGTLRASEKVAEPERSRYDGRALDTGRKAERRGASGWPGAFFPPGPADIDGWRAYLADNPGAKPGVHGKAHGLGARLDRLRMLGNGVVPQTAAVAFRVLAHRLGVDFTNLIPGKDDS